MLKKISRDIPVYFGISGYIENVFFLDINANPAK